MPIPGVTTSIRDRFYTVARQEAASGPRIVAIAKRSTATGTGGVTDLDVVRATVGTGPVAFVNVIPVPEVRADISPVSAVFTQFVPL